LQLVQELQKRTRQIDDMHSIVTKLQTDLDASKKEGNELRKVCRHICCSPPPATPTSTSSNTDVPFPKYILQKLNIKEQRFNDLEQKNLILVKDIKQREAAFSNIQQQLDTAKRARSGLTPRGGTVEEKLRGELVSLEGKLSTVEAEVSGIRGASSTVGGMSSSFDVNRAAELRQEATDWRNRSESLMTELKNVQDELVKSRIEEQKLNGKCAELSETKIRLEKELKRAQDEIESLRGLGDQTTNNMRQKLQKKEEEYLTLIEEHELQAEDLAIAKRKLEQYQKDTNNKDYSLQSLKDQIEKLKKEAEQLNAEKENLSDLLSDRGSELLETKRGLKEKIQELERREYQCTDLMNQLQSLRGEKADAEAESRLLSRHQDESSGQLSEAAAQLKATRERAERAETSAKQLEKQVAEARAAQAEMEIKLKETVDALEAAQDEVSARTENLRATGDDSDAYKAQIRKLEGKLAEVTAELEAEKKAMDKLSAEFDIARFEADERSKALDDASGRLGEAEKAIGNAKTRMGQDLDELKSLLDSKSGECEDLMQRINALEESLKDSNLQRGLADQRAEQLIAELEKAKSEQDRLKNQLIATSAQAEELEEDVRKRDYELGDAGKKLAQTEALMVQIRGLTSQMHEGQAALAGATEQISSINDELDAAKAALREKQEALDKAHGAVADKDRKMTALETELRQQQHAVKLLERRIQDREDKAFEAESGMTAAQVELSDLKSALREREMQVQDLHKEVENAQKEADLAKRERAEAEAMAEANRTEVLALQGELSAYDGYDGGRSVADSFAAGVRLDDDSSGMPVIAPGLSHLINDCTEEEEAEVLAANNEEEEVPPTTNKISDLSAVQLEASADGAAGAALAASSGSSDN
jgi:chromosome segregation ATPase